ncbi:MAG: GFA family protein [Alphaproteobacteria bacterium]|nr:GFA family protein [Alphaproteobacteria bacterium]
MSEQPRTCEGGCICGQVRYQTTSEPMIVHGCHCRGCQRNSGTAFAMNALFEADRVELMSGHVEEITVPTPSGVGQIISRCKYCKTAIWSNYNMGGLKERIRFLRVGTLDNPDRFSPDVHIFTETRHPMVHLPKDVPAVDKFYKWADIWPRESLDRLHVLEDAAGIKIT